MKKDKVITLKTLTKSSVWEVQENDVFRLWEAAEKDNDLKDNQRRYLDIIRSAFEIEPVKIDRTEVLEAFFEHIEKDVKTMGKGCLIYMQPIDVKIHQSGRKR